MIDLHVHTDRSDGSTAPADLVRQARELGIQALGIADHDTLAGYDAACPSAAEAGLELVCGVELSTRPEAQKNSNKRERSVHVLGYFICSAPSPDFRRWLESQQASRRQRNLDLVARLRQLGVEIALEDAEVYGRTQVGRPHFAKVLCDKGYVATVQDAFDVYLADDAKASVERDEPSLEEGIQRICAGGGFASLAHPVRLPQQGIDLETLVRKLRDTGLTGIEVYHSEHTPEHSAIYLDLARRLDLIATGGSDFHGDNKPGVQLGSGISGNVSLPYSLLEKIREMCFARQ